MYHLSPISRENASWLTCFFPAASDPLCAAWGQAGRNGSICPFPSATRRCGVRGRAGARFPCEVSSFARGTHSVPNLPTRRSSWTSGPPAEWAWIGGHGGTYRSSSCSHPTTCGREQAWDTEYRSRSQPSQSRGWSVGAKVNVSPPHHSVSFLSSILPPALLLPFLPRYLRLPRSHRLQSLKISSSMSFRSSRPRIMMHVFFAPRPSSIPLNSPSYDHPFVFFLFGSSPIHYITGPHVVRVESSLSRLLSISSYSVLYVFMAIGLTQAS